MRSLRTTLLAVSAAALLASPVFAQPPGGGRGMMQRGGGGIGALLGNPSVQEELKLDDKQKEKIREFVSKQQEARRGLRDLSEEERGEKMREMTKQAEAFAKETLTAEQNKRMKQIVLQQAGIGAFMMEDVQKELKLTDEQKEKIKTLTEDLRRDQGELFQGGGGGNPQENMQKFQALRKEYMAKAAGALTDAQKKQWSEMTGKAFELRMEMRRQDR
jgi:Spy/CpxP family protein refolding chaperone